MARPLRRRRDLAPGASSRDAADRSCDSAATCRHRPRFATSAWCRCGRVMSSFCSEDGRVCRGIRLWVVARPSVPPLSRTARGEQRTGKPSEEGGYRPLRFSSDRCSAAPGGARARPVVAARARAAPSGLPAVAVLAPVPRPGSQRAGDQRAEARVSSETRAAAVLHGAWSTAS